jgi:polysaccharide export outer membrane protein
MKFKIVLLLILLVLQACTSKKDVLYLQNAKTLDESAVSVMNITIQPNDILKITVGSLVPEAAVPYNKVSTGTLQANSVEIMKLEGYVVSGEQTIEFPVLGTLKVYGKTTDQLADHIKKELEQGGHLSNPTVDVRLLNAKFTVLGEVRTPGTFNYTDTNLTLLQALGMAGDLTINGQREDVLLIREVDGSRKISHINLKSVDWLDSELYQIKPNDVLIVNPNERVIKGSGLVDTGTFLAIASLTLSVVILLTR